MLGSNLHSRRLVAFALAASLLAFAVPAVAVAQDPSVEQYSATTPDAGGALAPDADGALGAQGAAAGPDANKAQRDLANIAAAAEQAREQPGGTGGSQLATELLRSDSGSGPGMGLFLWVAVAATALWAIGASVTRHRQNGEPA